jgi:hypothetical protein
VEDLDFAKASTIESIPSRLTEVGVRLRFFGSQPLLVVVSQQLVQEVDRLVGDVSLVFYERENRSQCESAFRVIMICQSRQKGGTYRS